jgi:hypothetical protein
MTRGHDHIDRETLTGYVEGTLDAATQKRVKAEISSCELCLGFHREIESELHSLSLSISLLWAAERISCPHRDILKGFLAGSLKKGEADYVEFHLREISCSFCAANLEDLRALESENETKLLDSARDRLSQSTSVFLGRSRGSR